MKQALLVLALPLCVWACGGTDAPPPMTAADAASGDTPPAGDPATEPPAADAPAGGSEEAWAGEAEAKADKGAGGDKPAETRTMDVIAKLVKENRQPVRDCMDKAKKQLPDL